MFKCNLSRKLLGAMLRFLMALYKVTKETLQATKCYYRLKCIGFCVFSSDFFKVISTLKPMVYDREYLCSICGHIQFVRISLHRIRSATSRQTLGFVPCKYQFFASKKNAFRKHGHCVRFSLLVLRREASYDRRFIHPIVIRCLNLVEVLIDADSGAVPTTKLIVY